MSRKTQCGMTMIELLVAMAIGVIVTLAVSQLLYTTENYKRSTTSTNDADQTGAYAVHALDRALRSAGSGIAQSASSSSQAGVLGCRLNAGSFLPRATAYPAPFSSYFLGGPTPAALRMAPVLIGGYQSDKRGTGTYETGKPSDVLVVMSASGAAGGVTRANYGAGTSTSIVLESTVGFNQYDVLLISQSNTTDCLLEEVGLQPTSNSTLTLSTTLPYYTTGTTTTLTTLNGSTASFITPLGNAAPPTAASPASPNNIQFTLFGVGTNNTLYSYDLLQNQKYVQNQGPTDTTQAIADGVVQMNAIYGVALNNLTPMVFTNWADPLLTPGYDINTVMTTPATQQLIVAVRVAIVVRGEYNDANNNNGANNGYANSTLSTSLTIFSGLVDANGTQLQKTLAVNPQYRYRVFEFTVPLRDMILLAGGP